MENRINIVELLKDCPQGMELDCTIYDNVTLEYVTKSKSLPICVRIQNKGTMFLSKYGQVYEDNCCKCVIFPKGKTTWEGFSRPFKDGDIIYNRLQKKICIYYLRGDEVPCIKGCRYNESNTQLQFETLKYPIPIVIQDYRFATEEEKTKLFNSIKENGYKWNTDTKTLEKVAKLIFNNGDIVATTNGAWIGITTGGVSGELIPTYCVIKSDGTFEAYIDVKNTWCFSRFATKEEREKLFKAIKDNDYKWNAETKTLEKLVVPEFKVGDKITNGKTSITIGYIDDEYYYEVGRNIATRLSIKNQDDWELVPDKFDISTLKPFDSRVLVRDYNSDEWRVSFWGCLIDNRYGYKYDTTRGYYKQCIPYEGNEYLIGKTDNCNDFYKTWES